MTKYTKQIFSKFFLTSVMLMVLLMVSVGYLTVTQQSNLLETGENYAVVAAKSNNEKLEIELEENTIEIDLSIFEKIKEYERYLYFTPFASLKYFFETVF